MLDPSANFFREFGKFFYDMGKAASMVWAVDAGADYFFPVKIPLEIGQIADTNEQQRPEKFIVHASL